MYYTMHLGLVKRFWLVAGGVFYLANWIVFIIQLIRTVDTLGNLTKPLPGVKLYA